jgi:uncharacterized protein (UPF0303 family)
MMSEDEELLFEVRGERAELGRERFTHADARAVGQAALALALEAGHPVAITVRRGSQTVFHAACDGTTAEHDDWLRRKINTALRHDIPSLEFVLRQRVAGRVPDWLDPHEFAIAGGAVPILLNDAVVGVIAVSGIVGSVRADHDLAMAALRVTATADAAEATAA